MLTFEFFKFILFIIAYFLLHKWYILEKQDLLKYKKNNLYFYNRKQYDSKGFRRDS